MRKIIATILAVIIGFTLVMMGCAEEKVEIKTFVGFEFSTRPDGLPALEKHYDFKVPEDSLMTGAPGASLLGLENHECDVAMAFGTDAIIAKYSWHVYQDDKAFWPPYDLVPYVREEVLDKYPEIEDILNELVATFPGGGKLATPALVAEGQKAWQELNAKVDNDKMEPDEVAREYLLENGLIDEEVEEATGKEVTVGNKNFTEEYIVGQLIKQVLEDRGFKVNLVSDLSTMALREGMEAGDIDICADYTGTAWMTHLGHEYTPGVDNNEIYEMVKEEDAGNGFIWLDAIWNNNTYVLVSWPEFVKEHDLTTISDLAALYNELSD